MTQDKNWIATDADKNDEIFECIKKLNVVYTHYKLTETEIKNITFEIQSKLKNLATYHVYIGNWTKEANFWLSKMYIEDTPRFHCI